MKVLLKNKLQASGTSSHCRKRLNMLTTNSSRTGSTKLTTEDARCSSTKTPSTLISRSRPITSMIPGANCLIKWWKETRDGFCKVCYHVLFFADDTSGARKHSQFCPCILPIFTPKNGVLRKSLSSQSVPWCLAKMSTWLRAISTGQRGDAAIGTTSIPWKKPLLTALCQRRQALHPCGEPDRFQTTGLTSVGSLNCLIQIGIGRCACMVLSPSHAKLSACARPIKAATTRHGFTWTSSAQRTITWWQTGSTNSLVRTSCAVPLRPAEKVHQWYHERHSFSSWYRDHSRTSVEWYVGNAYILAKWLDDASFPMRPTHAKYVQFFSWRAFIPNFHVSSHITQHRAQMSQKKKCVTSPRGEYGRMADWTSNTFVTQVTTDNVVMCEKTAQHCRLGVLQDSDFAGDLEDSTSTSVEENFYVFSEVEHKIWSYSVGCWFENWRTTALDLWSVVIEVLRSSKSIESRTHGAAGNSSRTHKSKPKQKGNRDVDELLNVDHVVANESFLIVELSCLFSKTTKWWSRWSSKADVVSRPIESRACLFDRINLDPKIQIKFADTKNQHAMNGTIFFDCSTSWISRCF